MYETHEEVIMKLENEISERARKMHHFGYDDYEQEMIDDLIGDLAYEQYSLDLENEGADLHSEPYSPDNE